MTTIKAKIINQPPHVRNDQGEYVLRMPCRACDNVEVLQTKDLEYFERQRAIAEANRYFCSSCFVPAETTQEPTETMQNVEQEACIHVLPEEKLLEIEAQAEARGIQKCIDSLEPSSAGESLKFSGEHSKGFDHGMNAARKTLKSLLPKDSNHPTE